MAYQKQLWEDLPSTNTPITSTRLNHIEDGIYDISIQPSEITDNYSTSTTIGYSANYINELDDKIDSINNYSTSEEQIGVWVDNKPLYRKALEYTISDTSSQQVTIPLGISNINKLIKANVTGLFNSSLWLPLNFYNGVGWNSFHVSTSGDIIYQKGTDYPCSKLCIIIEYTKTTD